MKEKIKLFLTGYSREKLIALILTVVIYSFAIDINEISRTYSVKVGIVTAEDQTIVSETVESIKVKAKGSVFDFAGIKEQDLSVTIDLSSKKPGKYTRSFDPSILPFGEKIKIEKITPAEIIIKTVKKEQNDKKNPVRD